MKLSSQERLTRLEEKQAQQRERILDQAVERLQIMWNATPETARQRFLARINGEDKAK